jgi:N-acetylmuramoyl-L-alanine amidase
VKGSGQRGLMCFALMSVLVAAVLLGTMELVWAFEAVREEPCRREYFRVAIDVGHDREKPGAMSATGIPEFIFNQRLARRLATELNRRGFALTLLIGEEGDPIELAERARLAERFGADAFVSLHHDSVQSLYLESWIVNGRERHHSERFSGYSLFFSTKNGTPRLSLLLAFLMGDALTRRGLQPSLHHAEPIQGEGRPLIDVERGIYRFDDLVILESTSMPAVLVEAGVIVNRTEEERLMGEAHQSTFVAALGDAVQHFCTIVSLPAVPTHPERSIPRSSSSKNKAGSQLR